MNSNKKSLLYLGIILIIALVVFVGLFFWIKNALKMPEVKPIEIKPTEKSIMNSLAAPVGGTQKPSELVSKEILNKLSVTVVRKPEKISEDILKSLSAPAQK